MRECWIVIIEKQRMVLKKENKWFQLKENKLIKRTHNFQKSVFLAEQMCWYWLGFVKIILSCQSCFGNRFTVNGEVVPQEVFASQAVFFWEKDLVRSLGYRHMAQPGWYTPGKFSLQSAFQAQLGWDHRTSVNRQVGFPVEWFWDLSR
jgi:hypothetical protein